MISYHLKVLELLFSLELDASFRFPVEIFTLEYTFSKRSSVCSALFIGLTIQHLSAKCALNIVTQLPQVEVSINILISHWTCSYYTWVTFFGWVFCCCVVYKGCLYCRYVPIGCYFRSGDVLRGSWPCSSKNGKLTFHSSFS